MARYSSVSVTTTTTTVPPTTRTIQSGPWCTSDGNRNFRRWYCERRNNMREGREEGRATATTSTQYRDEKSRVHIARTVCWSRAPINLRTEPPTPSGIYICGVDGPMLPPVATQECACTIIFDPPSCAKKNVGVLCITLKKAMPIPSTTSQTGVAH